MFQKLSFDFMKMYSLYYTIENLAYIQPHVKFCDFPTVTSQAEMFRTSHEAPSIGGFLLLMECGIAEYKKCLHLKLHHELLVQND